MKHIIEPIGILESHLSIAYASTVYILQVTGHPILIHLYGDVVFIFSSRNSRVFHLHTKLIWKSELEYLPELFKFKQYRMTDDKARNSHLLHMSKNSCLSWGGLSCSGFVKNNSEGSEASLNTQEETEQQPKQPLMMLSWFELQMGLC